MTDSEKELLEGLRREVSKDMSLAVANFKVWLLATVLSNVVLVGLPALYVFFTTASAANAAMQVALDNKERLDGRTEFMVSTTQRLQGVERTLAQHHDYTPIGNGDPIPR